MNINWERMLPVEGDTIAIEDDPILRPLMVDILSELGLTVLAFQCADDALTHMLGSPGVYPLVVVDHGLPGRIQGTEFIEMVKARWPSTAAILTSGYDLTSASLPPETIYLQKPWSLDDLVGSVVKLLQPDFPIAKVVRSPL